MNIQMALSYIVHNRQELLKADRDLLFAAADAITFAEWELGTVDTSINHLADDIQ